MSAPEMPKIEIVIYPEVPERSQECYCRVCRVYVRGMVGEPCPWCVQRSKRGGR